MRVRALVGLLWICGCTTQEDPGRDNPSLQPLYDSVAGLCDSDECRQRSYTECKNTVFRQDVLTAYTAAHTRECLDTQVSFNKCQRDSRNCEDGACDRDALSEACVTGSSSIGVGLAPDVANVIVAASRYLNACRSFASEMGKFEFEAALIARFERIGFEYGEPCRSAFVAALECEIGLPCGADSSEECTTQANAIEAECPLSRLTIGLAPSEDGSFVLSGFDYLVSCIPDLAQHAEFEGILDRVTRETSDVWEKMLDLPAGECSVMLQERDARPGCAMTQAVTIRPNAEAAVEFLPVCRGSLCLPRGDLTVDVRLSDSQDAISVHTDLAYELECNGNGDVFMDDPCNDQAMLEGSADMPGGLHMPVIGPIQSGRWKLQFPELPEGPCLLSVRARHVAESVRCDATHIFTIERNQGNTEKVVLDCTEG